MRRSPVRALTTGALVALTLGAQCESSGTGTDPDPVPPVLSIDKGDNQTAAIGAAVAVAPSVKVLNAAGQGVAGISVNFAIATGGGLLTGNTQTTNSSGIATLGSWTLGGMPGSNTITANAGGTTGGPLTFTATATAGPAKNIEASAGNNQSVILGSPVTTSPAVRVTDAGGNPVTGTSVTFAIASGGGTISGGTQTTNANGVAAITTWTPGTVGTNTITATATGLTGSPVTFIATAAIGPANKLTFKTSPSTSAANRAAFSAQPVVQISDVNGNAVSQSGTVVTAAITAGGGTLGGTATATTNATGAATFTDLSISGTVGQRTLTFTAGTLTAATANVTTSAGAATTIAVNANNNQTAPVGTALTTPPSVKVSDADGNGVSGVAVTFAITAGGGSATGLSTTTDATGVARPASWTLGSSPGTNTMTATAAGLTGSPVTLTATAGAAAVTLTSVSPGTLTPGTTATIAGTGFSTTLASNTVTVDGVAATVTAATTTQLTITVPSSMPCEPTHDATISVTVTGNAAQTITKPLQVATLRSLSVGQAVVVTAAAEQRCNELANNGTSRYFISISNTNSTYSTTGASFQLRGAAGSSAPAPRTVRQLTGDASRSRVLTPLTQDQIAEQFHMKILDQNIKYLREHRGELLTKRNRASFAAISTTPTVNTQVNINIPNLNNSNICTSPIAMTGRIAAVGTKVVVVEDNANPFAGTLDTMYVRIASEFDNVMYPILTANYGNPLAKDATTDNNGRIVMVFTRKVADNFSSLAGFVVSCDFATTTSASNTQTNTGEYFYARSPLLGSGTISTADSPAYWNWTMRGTIIHEVKHIVSFAERLSRSAASFEDSWLEETTARMSEELYDRNLYSLAVKSNIGYGSSGSQVGPYCGVRACGTPAKPRGIIRVFEELGPKWYATPELYSPIGRIDASDFSFYATGWSLVRWAIDQDTKTESAFLQALTQEATLTGVANITSRTGRPWSEMIQEWSLAMAVDDYPGFTASGTPATRLSQPTWNFRNVFSGYKTDFSSAAFSAWPLVPIAKTFGTFTADVSNVRPGTSAIIELSGTATAKQLLELKALSGSGAAAAELKISIVRVQ